MSWDGLCCTAIQTRATYVHNVDEAPKFMRGNCLGDFTDELEEFGSVSYLEKFV